VNLVIFLAVMDSLVVIALLMLDSIDDRVGMHFETMLLGTSVNFIIPRIPIPGCL
jgi:hypothetical protein